MNFILLINASPSQQGSITAYHFSKAVLAQEHRLLRIFFYYDGVLNANVLNEIPSDEFNIVKAWQELAAEYGIELIVCVAAAQRRGIVNETPGFKISGLGQLIEGIINCDRFITFN